MKPALDNEMEFDPDQYMEEKGIGLDEVEPVGVSPSPSPEQDFNADQYMQEQGIDSDSDMYKPQEFGTAEAAKLFGQGLTYENLDEILGALKATGKTAFGDKKFSDWLQTYKQERNVEREEFERLHQQHPWKAFAAEGAGAVYSPINKLFAPAKAASGVMEAIKSGALTAGKAGLATGIGASEQSLEDPLAYAKDVATYGATGGVLGGGLGALGYGATKGLSALGTQFEESGPFGKNVVNAFRKSKEGEGFVSEGSEERIEELAEKTARKFGDVMYAEEGPIAKTSKEISDYFDTASNEGAKVQGAFDEDLKNSVASFITDLETNNLLRPKISKEVAQEYPKVFPPKSTIQSIEAQNKILPQSFRNIVGRSSDVQSSMSSKEVKLFTEMVQKLFSNQLNPSEAYNFARWLQGEQIPGFAKLGSSKFKQLVPRELVDSLKQAAKNSADDVLGQNSQEIFDKFKNVRANTVETILNKGKPTDLANIWQSDYAKGEIKSRLYDDFKKILESLSDPSQSGTESRNTIKILQKRIDELNQNYPGMNIQIKDLIDEVKDVASQKTIRSKIWANSSHTSSGSDVWSRLVDITGYGGAITAGKVARVPLQINNQLVKAEDATLIPLAEKLKQNPSLQHIGQALEDGVRNRSGKNAALFMILQNPEARAIAGGMLGVDQNEKR